MNRRGFFKAVIGGIVGLAVFPKMAKASANPDTFPIKHKIDVVVLNHYHKRITIKEACIQLRALRDEMGVKQFNSKYRELYMKHDHPVRTKACRNLVSEFFADDKHPMDR